MAITVFISLYSTRLVLSTLGVADFGIYNLVGGVIAMLGFLNSSMAAATQRFISFAQGAGDIEKVKRIFNMSSLLHWFIAILVLLLFESVGYYLFHFVLNISPDRISAAKLIYKFMIVSTIFTVISVPYEAVITSHENMLVYAVLGIVEAVLKLAIAVFISYSSIDHLLLYGLLMAIISILLLIVRRIYCHRNYAECVLNFKIYFDKPILKNISGFALWSLLGSSTNLIINYGQGILINVFFGTVVNSAQGISAQISGQLNVLATTLIKALKPIIDKNEGAGNRSSMLKAALVGSKVSFFLLIIIYIPFIIELPYIFKLWLKNVPDYSIIFCSLLLIRNLIEQLFIPLVAAINAEGNIKGYQKSSSFLLLFPLLVSYVLFRLNYPPYALYIVFVVYSLIASCIILYYANINCNLSIKIFLIDVVLKCLIVFSVVFIIAYIPHLLLNDGLIRLLLVGLFTIVPFFIIIFIFGFSNDEIAKIKIIFKRKL